MLIGAPSQFQTRITPSSTFATWSCDSCQRAARVDFRPGPVTPEKMRAIADRIRAMHQERTRGRCPRSIVTESNQASYLHSFVQSRDGVPSALIPHFKLYTQKPDKVSYKGNAPLIVIGRD